MPDLFTDIRQGRWQDCSHDKPILRPDVIITDPPYTDKTVKGYRSGTHGNIIPYSSISKNEMEELCELAAKAAKFWVIIFSDHVGWQWASENLEYLGMYVFAPVVWAKTNPPPRMCADGPTSACEHICIARQKLPRYRSGSRPGCYHGPQNKDEKIVTGQKPLWLMQAIIRDYCLPGDHILDPYCGSGTTAIAAKIEGCSCTTFEANPRRFKQAQRRISKQRPGVLPFQSHQQPAQQQALGII